METASTTRATTAAARFPKQHQGTTESRHDPIADRWTIFAPHRERRPDDFQLLQGPAANPSTCPFCQGHEASTPEPVWVGRTPELESLLASGSYDPAPPSNPGIGAAGPELSAQYSQGIDDGWAAPCEPWSVRVVPNKFPAVGAHPGHIAQPIESTSNPLFQARRVGGGHEVVIESPRHIESMTELDLDEVGLVFAAYRDRIRYWRSISGIRYISVFKNAGRDAGASLQHAHGQLVALNTIPSEVAQTCDRLERYRATTGCCLHCDLVRAELKAKERVVYQNDSLIAFCPFASAMPYLVRITTKQHHDRFEDLPSNTIQEVARLTRRIVGWLQQIRPGTAYNYLLHTRPPRSPGDRDAHHWSLDLFPRVTRMAGFEFSSQCMINPFLPERVAERFRAVASSEGLRRNFSSLDDTKRLTPKTRSR